jgi:hypothetical protein
MILDQLSSIPDCVGAGDLGGGAYRLDFSDGKSRLATKAEIDVAIAAVQAEDAKRVESDAARDDAKRALSALDTIISGIDAATLAQAKTAIKQLAQIQKNIILAALGR